MATLTTQSAPAGQSAETDDSVYYFAYGSNTRQQLEERLGHGVEAVGPASLPGYRFVYMGRSVKWKCATANAVDSQALHYIWGALYKLRSADFELLDGREGVKVDEEGNQVGRYRRIKEIVKLNSKSLPPMSLPAELYVMTGHLKVDREVRPPSRAYLLNVIESALANGLPRDYIEHVIMPLQCWDAEVIVP